MGDVRWDWNGMGPAVDLDLGSGGHRSRGRSRARGRVASAGFFPGSGGAASQSGAARVWARMTRAHLWLYAVLAHPWRRGCLRPATFEGTPSPRDSRRVDISMHPRAQRLRSDRPRSRSRATIRTRGRPRAHMHNATSPRSKATCAGMCMCSTCTKYVLSL